MLRVDVTHVADAFAGYACALDGGGRSGSGVSPITLTLGWSHQAHVPLPGGGDAFTWVDNLAARREVAAEFGDEVIVASDVERPEVDVGRDEPALVVRPEQVGAATRSAVRGDGPGSLR